MSKASALTDEILTSYVHDAAETMLTATKSSSFPRTEEEIVKVITARVFGFIAGKYKIDLYNSKAAQEQCEFVKQYTKSYVNDNPEFVKELFALREKTIPKSKENTKLGTDTIKLMKESPQAHPVEMLSIIFPALANELRVTVPALEKILAQATEQMNQNQINKMTTPYAIYISATTIDAVLGLESKNLSPEELNEIVSKALTLAESKKTNGNESPK